MKKLAGVGFLFIVVVLVMMLSVSLVGAQEGDAADGEAAASEEAAPAEVVPDKTAVRIDFELAGQEAKRGHYSVQVPGGAEVASWYALDGWQDSGWITDLELARDDVWVQVVYYPGPDTEGTVLTILNHVADEEYGWLGRGKAHALEVAWPDQEIMSEAEMN